MCTARAQTSVIEPWEIGGLDLWSTIVPGDRAAERGGKKCRGHVVLIEGKSMGIGCQNNRGHHAACLSRHSGSLSESGTVMWLQDFAFHLQSLSIGVHHFFCFCLSWTTHHVFFFLPTTPGMTSTLRSSRRLWSFTSLQTSTSFKPWGT